MMVGYKRYAPAVLTRDRAQYPLLSLELVRVVVSRLGVAGEYGVLCVGRWETLAVCL